VLTAHATAAEPTLFAMLLLLLLLLCTVGIDCSPLKQSRPTSFSGCSE
jgi:hypothetical protein